MSLDSETSESSDYPRVSLRLTSELSPVAGHMAACYRGCLLVLGGYHESSTTEFRKGEDLFVLPYALSANLGVWLKLKCSEGDVPKSNCGGTALIVRDSLYVFGGAVILAENMARRRNVASSALYRLDLKSGRWEFIHISSEQLVPTPRDKMAAWAAHEKLFYFGGYGIRLSRLENSESYLFEEDDYEDGEPGSCWNNQLLQFDITTSTWSLLPKRGQVPSHRAAAGAAYVPDLNAVFLFGGRCEQGRMNDLHRLDLYTLEWSRIDLDYTPVRRSWCTFTPVLERKLIVMQGGYSNNDEPLGDVWHLDLSEMYEKQKIRDGTARPRWTCVRETDPVVPVDPNDTSESPPAEVSPYLRFGTRPPPMAAPCLNSINLERLQPPSLLSICLRRLNRSSLRILAPEVLVNLRRKIDFLSDLRRFKTARSFLPTSDEKLTAARTCPSISGLSVGDIFDFAKKCVIKGMDSSSFAFGFCTSVRICGLRFNGDRTGQQERKKCVHFESVAVAKPAHCPNAHGSLAEWMKEAGCPLSLFDYPQLAADFRRWPRIEVKAAAEEAERRFGSPAHRYSLAWCHYRILSNEVSRKCFGEHLGFRKFADELLTMLSRMARLPDVEFLMNLGDWPLEKKAEGGVPFVSWCGSNSTRDFVLPTYELMNSVIHSMDRVSLDTHSAIGPRPIEWAEKKPTAVFRGRDSNQERIEFAKAAVSHPELLDGGITRYFFHDAAANPKIVNQTAFHEFFKHKFVVSLDGTVAAYRFPFLLSGNSLVFKQESPFFEHFYSQLRSNVHFVPFASVQQLLQLIEEWRDRPRPDRMLREMREFWLRNLQPVDLFCYWGMFLQASGTTRILDGFGTRKTKRQLKSTERSIVQLQQKKRKLRRACRAKIGKLAVGCFVGSLAGGLVLTLFVGISIVSWIVCTLLCLIVGLFVFVVARRIPLGKSFILSIL
ncbi:KDEL motif-containing protein 1 [Aphelenchoides fujianensis]|nr:KDEL motif-containing protein 1 [Aphelenchoides fujianensis]